MIFNYGMAMYRAGQMTNKSKEEVDQFIQPAGFNVNAEI
jgi:hypothetical protein